MPDTLYFIHALTSVHAGTGQGIDAIDLPIARERATSLPFIPGSTLKGCLRDTARQNGNSEIEAIFGPDRNSASLHAGAVSLGDGQLLLFPIRSLAGTFVWATCPYLLSRFKRDAQSCGHTLKLPVPQPPDDQAWVANDSVLLKHLENKLVLEEYDLSGHLKSEVGEWANSLADQLFTDQPEFHASLRARLVILGDSMLFSLARTATEIQAHIALDESSGTVQDGALWYQESLPAESVLFGILRAAPPRRSGSALKPESIASQILPGKKPMQIGGKSGTGQGWVRVVAAGGAA